MDQPFGLRAGPVRQFDGREPVCDALDDACVGELYLSGTGVVPPFTDRVQPVVHPEAEEDSRGRVRGAVVDADTKDALHAGQ